MGKATSITNFLSKEHKTYKFKGEWHEAFGEPEVNGVWFVWGRSGNGKTSFVLHLCKELCRFGRGVFNSLEEGGSLSLQNSFKRAGMVAVRRKLVLVSETMEELSERLSKPKGPDFAVIDSYQYTKMSFPQYLEFKERHANKLLIFTSQADGNKPKGRTADNVMYDASLKIWVEGHKAFSKGRFIGPNGGNYTIWQEGAERYFGK